MQQLARRPFGISLREILPQANFSGCHDIVVQSCCGSWEMVCEGDVFIALDLPEGDGHQFVEKAIELGARAVVTERMVPSNVPVCVVADTRHAYGKICQALLDFPAQQIQTIGITGTNGKTVTSQLIQHVLKANGMSAGVYDTLGCNDSFQSVQTTNDSPQPPQLANFLANTLSNGCSHAVLEASSTSLAQRRLAGIELDATIITNLRSDHVDYHGSHENYLKAKTRIFDHLKPEGFAIVNLDDPRSEAMLPHIENPALTYSMQQSAEVTAQVIERFPSEQTFLLQAGNESVPVRTTMIGDHHVYNCLAAAAFGLVSGVDLTTIARGLEATGHVAGRLERIECGQPFSLYVDYARTPDQLATALKSIRQVVSGKIICVYGVPEGRSAEIRPRLGREVERHADWGVLTSGDGNTDSFLQDAHDLLDGYQKPGRDHLRPSRQEAIRYALSQASEGDAVLIAGKGDESYQLEEQNAWQTDDRQVCRDYLLDHESEVAPIASYVEDDEPQIYNIRDYRR